jgi:hypothetical protein
MTLPLILFFLFFFFRVCLFFFFFCSGCIFIVWPSIPQTVSVFLCTCIQYSCTFIFCITCSAISNGLGCYLGYRSFESAACTRTFTFPMAWVVTFPRLPSLRHVGTFTSSLVIICIRLESLSTGF